MSSKRLRQPQFDVCANVVVGGQIIQVVFGEGVEPAQPRARLHLAEIMQRTVGGIAALDGTNFNQRKKLLPEFVLSRLSIGFHGQQGVEPNRTRLGSVVIPVEHTPAALVCQGSA